MAKEAGLGDRLFIHTYNLSGDVGSVQTLGLNYAEQVVTGIDKSSTERLLLLGDGEIGFNNYFNPEDGAGVEGLHEVLNTLPATDRIASYFRGIVLGTMTASLVGKQVNYGLARGADGALIGAAISVKANGTELEYGEAGTPGPRTDVAATDGTGFDGGLRRRGASNIVSSSIANPTNILTAGPHGLATGDWVTIAGHVGMIPEVNGDHEVTRVDDYNFTVAVNVTTAGTGGTAQPIVAIVSSSVADPSVITTETAHGFVTGDWVVIAGHVGSTPDINKAYIVTYVGPTSFTIPEDVTVGGTGGTVTRTSTVLGLSAYLHLLAFAGTDVTVKLQHSADNADTDAYVDITDGDFAEAAAVTSERIDTGPRLIRRWIRVVTTTVAGFNPATFAVAVCRK
ncbi:MAG TPA: hypothetical protein VMW79_06145 [Anaerolineae bacterium]|nr:hypothetical protein [Anaerolineae bacterium]HUW95985.1 hypothetical protein [Anaerolineae bacterium]